MTFLNGDRSLAVTRMLSNCEQNSPDSETPFPAAREPELWVPMGTHGSERYHASRGLTDIAQLPSIWDLEDEIEWLIENMIAARSITLLSADSGTGKTWLAYAIAGAVASGTEFIGQRVTKCPVLYLDGENPPAIPRRNLRELGIKRTQDLQVWGGWVKWDGKLEPPPGPDDPRIMQYVDREPPLLIWDSLVEFHPGDEQSATETRSFMSKFRHLANRRATVLLLHHTGKGENTKQYRGSSDIKAAVDTAYVLTGKPQGGKLHRLTMTNFKSRMAAGQNFELEFKEGHGFVPADAATPARAEAVSDAIDTILRRAGNPLNGKEIVERCVERGFGKHRVEQALKNGAWPWKQGNGREHLYSPRPAPACEATPTTGELAA